MHCSRARVRKNRTGVELCSNRTDADDVGPRYRVLWPSVLPKFFEAVDVAVVRLAVDELSHGAAHGHALDGRLESLHADGDLPFGWPIVTDSVVSRLTSLGIVSWSCAAAARHIAPVIA